MGLQAFGLSRSQANQDLFVVGATAKREGFFIEIGGFHSQELSNTYLLETTFEWSGVIVEIIPRNSSEISLNRKATVLCEDATRMDWSLKRKQLEIPDEVDYLQVDCEPALSSLIALLRVLRSGIRPRVITFEHDVYAPSTLLRVLHQGRFVRLTSRLLLRGLGYRLVAPNVATSSGNPFEDWWVRGLEPSFPFRPRPGQVTDSTEFLTRNNLLDAYERLARSLNTNPR